MRKPKLLRAAYRILLPLILSRISNLPRLVGAYQSFFSDWRRFVSLGGVAAPEEFTLFLGDKGSESQGGGHPYFYQDIWALHKLAMFHPVEHHDIGSRLDGFVGQATVLSKISFWDIRPPAVKLPGFEYRYGSILEMPIPSWSVESLSCLHTIEHIGLGRYGDPIDPRGTEKALVELSRILAPGGQLLLSCPIGRERVCFNGQRILDPRRAIDSLSDLTFLEFSVIGDLESGNYPFHAKARPEDFIKAKEALGLYVFTRKR
jgi:hypothetical protein